MTDRFSFNAIKIIMDEFNRRQGFNLVIQQWQHEPGAKYVYPYLILHCNITYGSNPDIHKTGTIHVTWEELDLNYFIKFIDTESRRVPIQNEHNYERQLKRKLDDVITTYLAF